MKPIAFITGATAGIGRATAQILAENNYNIIITGRRENALDELQNNLEEKTAAKVYSLPFDVRDKVETENNINSLPEAWRDIDVLINNAGLAVGKNPVNEGIFEDWERMIDTNIKGLLYVSRFLSDYMVNKKKGHIINVGSIAGKQVYKNGNVYCATKYAVDALTQGMRIDLLPYNIKVSSICPGNVETEFSEVRFKGDTERAQKVYEGYTPLYAEDIAEAILFIVTRPAHVNINDMLIMSTAQADAHHLNRNQGK